MNISHRDFTVFLWFSSITAISNCFTWGSVCPAYLQFHRALKVQGIDRNTLPYKAPFQPFLTYPAFSFFVIVMIFSGFPVFVGKFNHQEFITSYINITMFFILYVGFKFVCKTQIRVPSEIDILTGKAEFHMQEDRWVGSIPLSQRTGEGVNIP